MSSGERRLAAIMYTDMVGYTALAQRNEALSLTLVDEQRRLLRPVFSRHGGREVKTMGDAFMVEFPNALDAVRCAYDVQRATREFNISQSQESRIHLRVGVHLGDVVDTQGDISGDAVNVASRIEPLAEDGGVCLTRQVYDQIQNKVSFQMSSMGSRTLKNVAAPVEVFKIEMPNEGEGILRPRPDRARIAVLPFENISPDPTDEYFADGMTEELIERLSQVRGLKVIARTSVMGYKKKEKKVSEISTELGVGSVVEGSVRKAGNRVRVTAQLIDAGTDEHLWSAHYDKDLDDIFAVQADIAGRIANAMPANLVGNQALVAEGGTSNAKAYAYYLKGRQLYYQSTEESVRNAIALFESATEVDPRFAKAWAAHARCIISLGFMGLLGYQETLDKANQVLQKALAIDENLAEAHVVLSLIAWIGDDQVNDDGEARRALELNPSLADAYGMLGLVRASRGYPKEAIRLYEAAYELDPLSPLVIDRLGEMWMYSGRVAEAQDFWERNLSFAPLEATENLIGCHLLKGELDQADALLKSLERDFPNTLRTLLTRGTVAAIKGERLVAQKAILEMEEKYNPGNRNKMVGFVRYFLGDMDGFFAAMFRDVENHTLDPVTLRYSPFFAKARADPRYRELMLKNKEDPDLKESF
ncbi:MAG TPA: adenylate/guanylate cyclase domain-containing protein [Nitrososphaerales archaeon]|nr:adenylate/guanylate cyclase domain-containing protein [Nitrososphaerales archaeon]